MGRQRSRKDAPSPIKDFPAVCRAAGKSYLAYGRLVAKESMQEGVTYDAEFWDSAAADAERAAQLFEAVQARALEQARIRTIQILREAGLYPWASALEKNDASLLGV